MHPIVRYRRGMGWTQAELAERVGVNINTVRAWEKGAQPRPRHLQALAQAFGATGFELDAAIHDWKEAQGEKEAA